MSWGRRYFAVQSVAGALWWIAVCTRPGVRSATLGSLDPVVVAVFDVPLFVVASALAAAGSRAAAVVTTAAMPNRLVIAGPYRSVRNPMALAGIAQGVAVGLLLTSWMVVVYALAGSIVWNCVVRPLEEADLDHRFGDDFRRYAAGVRCWVPRVAGPGERPGGRDQPTAPLMLTSQVTPKRSVTMPNVSPHGAFVRGSMIVFAPSASPFQ